MFISTLLSLLSTLSLAAAACSPSTNSTFAPYHVTVFSGDATVGSPTWNSLNFTDPNTCEDFSCRVEWARGTTEDSPLTRFLPCSAEHPEVEFYRPEFRQLQIRHKFQTLNEQGDTLSWTALANGSVPFTYVCGASARWCSWLLREGVTADLPVITVEVVA
ncbi:hypothetical protein EDC01DRAFT_775066 [Geopyxis carbonaria]|nr:hypothetical protein EDC01DRAFT_775066 [Geopyxis carbonaria]